MHKILKQLQWRYATKKFDPNKKLTDEQLSILKRAVVLSPSSYGLQPWKILIIEDQETKDALVEHSYGQEKVSQCSQLFVFCRPNNITEEFIDKYVEKIMAVRNQTKEDVEGTAQAMKDSILGKSKKERQQRAEKQIYIPLGFLLETAAMLEIDAGPMEGFTREGYSQELNLEENGYTPVVLCAVGFRSPDDQYQDYEKVRFDMDEVIDTI